MRYKIHCPKLDADGRLYTTYSVPKYLWVTHEIQDTLSQNVYINICQGCLAYSLLDINNHEKLLYAEYISCQTQTERLPRTSEYTNNNIDSCTV